MDDGEQLGVMKTIEAIDLAKNRKMDLVEIAASNNPPVCKIIDYGKLSIKNRRKKRGQKNKKQ